jgi:CRISPR system Cascade subunit CasB
MSMPDAKAQADAALKWWNGLQPRETSDGYRRSGDRAALAKLRRCSAPIDAAIEPATIDLFQNLGFTAPEKALPIVAALAAVLAHVREHKPGKLARALGPPPGGKPEEALLKPLRFKRLVGARGPDEILIGFRRAVQMLGQAADVRDLAKQILAWDEDGFGDRVRVRFAFDYHNAGDFAPGSETAENANKE